MNNIKENLANNLSKLRIKNKLTQADLAKKINYTDKSISKWENGDSTPPIDVIKLLADTYGVTVDYLLSNDADENMDKRYKRDKSSRANKLIITLLAVSLVWLVATSLFVYGSLYSWLQKPWLCFVVAVPISLIVFLIFNCIWGRRSFIFIIVSLLVWSTLTTMFLFFALFTPVTPWIIFILGIPPQIAIILWSQLKRHRK